MSLHPSSTLCGTSPTVSRASSWHVSLVRAHSSIVLNTPSTASRAIRPVEMISSLSNHNPGKHNSLFSSREHQDAQELFQVVSECLKNELAAVDKEGLRDRGFGLFGSSSSLAKTGGTTTTALLAAKEIGKTVRYKYKETYCYIHLQMQRRPRNYVVTMERIDDAKGLKKKGKKDGDGV